MEGKSVTWSELANWNKEEYLLVDVREDSQSSYGMIPGAISIPGTKLHELYQLPKEKRIVLYCQKGELSKEILEVMLDAGYDACHLAGGYLSYVASL